MGLHFDKQMGRDVLVMTADVSAAAKTPARLVGRLLSGHQGESLLYGSDGVVFDAVAQFDEDLPTALHLYFQGTGYDYERVTGTRWLALSCQTFQPPRDRGAAKKEDRDMSRVLGGWVYHSPNAIVADWIRTLRDAERQVYELLISRELMGGIGVIETPDGAEIPVLPKKSVPAPRSNSLLLRGTVSPATLARLADSLGVDLGVMEVPNVVPEMPPAWIVDPRPMEALAERVTQGDIESIAAAMQGMTDRFRGALEYVIHDERMVMLPADPVPVLPEDDTDTVAAVFDLLVEAPELSPIRGTIRDTRDLLTQVMPKLPGPAVAAIVGNLRQLAGAA